MKEYKYDELTESQKESARELSPTDYKEYVYIPQGVEIYLWFPITKNKEN